MANLEDVLSMIQVSTLVITFCLGWIAGELSC